MDYNGIPLAYAVVADCPAFGMGLTAIEQTDMITSHEVIEAATRLTGDNLLITEQTLLRLRQTATGWERRPAVELKGKAQAVVLYAPQRPTPATETDPVGHVAGFTPSG